VGPENGITLPGATCGDSLPPTVPLVPLLLDWYFEVEMVLSTQCIMQPKPRKMLIHVAGDLQGVTPKDVALYHLKTIHRRYWLFCGVRRKSFEDMTMEPYDRL
jgi:3-isopropylmalate/(R)-2-methylmalate dehydratase large subunit